VLFDSSVADVSTEVSVTEVSVAVAVAVSLAVAVAEVSDAVIVALESESEAVASVPDVEPPESPVSELSAGWKQAESRAAGPIAYASRVRMPRR
jgi:hypothetical protein